MPRLLHFFLSLGATVLFVAAVIAPLTEAAGR